MSILRVNKIAASGQTSENTGSVFFDGTGDFLRNQGNGSGGSTNFSDFDFGSNDFTIEGFFYSNDITSGMPTALAQVTVANNGDISWRFRYSSNKIDVKSFNGTSEIGVVQSGTISSDTWYHVAYVREGSTFTLYIDGIAVDSDTSSASINFESFWNLNIGNGYGSNHFTGYISNLRIIKGKALYTSNFTPPTTELEVTPETVLVVCHDGENIFADKTGRHIIAAYGDRLSSPTPTATDSPIGITTNYPSVTRSVDVTAGPVLQGNLEYNSQNFLVLPKGTTTERFPDFGAVDAASARGVFIAGGEGPSGTTGVNTIEFITIASTGDAQDFGDLTTVARRAAGCSSSTRGLSAGGYRAPVYSNTIDYITISSTGNGQDFGDLLGAQWAKGSFSNSTRGIWSGGYSNVSPFNIRTIEYVTIQSQGNTIKFGELSTTTGLREIGGAASTTRGLFAGGRTATPTNVDKNIIEYITISSTGNPVDFGDLNASSGRTGVAGASNSTRGLFFGGYQSGSINTIEFVTIASLGDAIDFGDMTGSKFLIGATSSKIRATAAGGTGPTNVIEYVTIATTGDAQDFGDLSAARNEIAAVSNGHGGLG